MTPLQFLHDTRIQEATKLLKTSSLSATHISFMVGYTSLSHFSTVFKEHTGVSPSIFRKI
ncbi:helix-turn-helix transcriptional regulator [Paenibacillus amylolyticus]|uniref:helix-turn-helix transcriptional regulator n=1 Tax=Paenibacillus amylolyticus TaxID=1451 RepID=UPI003EB733B0